MVPQIPCMITDCRGDRGLPFSDEAAHGKIFQQMRGTCKKLRKSVDGTYRGAA